jgi:uncharacterized protein
MPHGVVHFEIGGPDDGELAEFYSELLGWDTRSVPGYTLVDTSGGAGINGGIALTPDNTAAVTFYIETEDLQAILDKVNLLGGKTQTPITERAGMVTFAKFEDLDGLVVGLVLGPVDPALPASLQPSPDPGSGPAGAGRPAGPPPSAGAGAPVDWFEILSQDPERTQRFYAEIFGWQIGGSGLDYRMVDTGSPRGIRGGIGRGQPDSWVTVFANVPDVETILARAVELGGSREYGPMIIDDHMRTGALRDPAGNIFGVYHHPPHA